MWDKPKEARKLFNGLLTLLKNSIVTPDSRISRAVHTDSSTKYSCSKICQMSLSGNTVETHLTASACRSITGASTERCAIAPSSPSKRVTSSPWQRRCSRSPTRTHNITLKTSTPRSSLQSLGSSGSFALSQGRNEWRAVRRREGLGTPIRYSVLAGVCAGFVQVSLVLQLHPPKSEREREGDK